MLLISTSCAISNSSEDNIQNSLDANQLEFLEWEPSSDFSNIIIKVHGYNDYSNSFNVSGKYFANHGIKSLSFDLNGFGKNTNAGEWFGLKLHVKNIFNIVKKIIFIVVINKLIIKTLLFYHIRLIEQLLFKCFNFNLFISRILVKILKLP